MAKDKEKQDEVKASEESVEEAQSVPKTEVSLPEGGASKAQDEALLYYKAHGVNALGYVDPSRDQEPDIAPEFGVHPHPDMSNPAPPEDAVGSEPAESPVVASFEEKEEKASEAADAVAKDFNDANAEDDDVADLSAGDALNLHLTPDESPKTSGAAGKHNS